MVFTSPLQGLLRWFDSTLAHQVERSLVSASDMTTLARGVMMTAVIGSFELMVVLFDSAPIQVTLK